MPEVTLTNCVESAQSSKYAPPMLSSSGDVATSAQVAAAVSVVFSANKQAPSCLVGEPAEAEAEAEDAEVEEAAEVGGKSW